MKDKDKEKLLEEIFKNVSALIQEGLVSRNPEILALGKSLRLLLLLAASGDIEGVNLFLFKYLELENNKKKSPVSTFSGMSLCLN